MVDNRFRHLPVLDKDDAVVGLLDIAKCLYDAISVLEKVQQGKTQDGDEASNAGSMMATAMTTAMMKAAAAGTGGKKGRGNNEAQLEMMRLLMEQMFGGAQPSLKDIIRGKPLPSIRQSSNVREASSKMAQHRKGLLVLDEDDEVVGILTPKDILCRVVAHNKSPDLTAVMSVMTPNPDSVFADLTLLDALREMHDQKFLHLPVKNEQGRVIGLVDVMDLVSHTAGGEGGKGWRDFFQGALAARGDRGDENSASDSASERSASKAHKTATTAPGPIRAKYLQQTPAAAGINDGTSMYSFNPTDLRLMTPAVARGGESLALLQEVDFKVVDQAGNLHKIRCNASSLDNMKTVIAEKLSLKIDSSKQNLVLKYVDEEKDEVLLTSNASLHDAIHSSRQTGSYSVKLIATIVPKTAGAASPLNGPMAGYVFLGVGVVAAVAAIAAVLLTRGKKN